MLISVIMANYNGEKYIKEAIQSVIKQKNIKYEFIIVDDGSTDNSRVIINNFSEQYADLIKPIFQPHNCGQGASFNLGIEISKGEIICFLDSDDLWLPNKLENVYNVFDNKGNIAFHQHNLQIMYGRVLGNKNFRDVLMTGDFLNYTKKNKILPDFIPTSGLSFNRHILKKVLPIPNSFVTCADGYLTRTCLCFGNVEANYDAWGIYRIHSDNYTYANQDFNVKEYLNDLLIPAVNNFYKNQGINLTLPSPQSYSNKNIQDKILDVNIRMILQKISNLTTVF